MYVPCGMDRASQAHVLEPVILEDNPSIRLEDFELVLRWIQEMRENNKDIYLPPDFE